MLVHRARSLAATAGVLVTVPALAAGAGPGAPGIGDAYYPDYGNGGYDVSHYDLRLRYRPGGDRLEGTATILATATQDLTRFDLDFALPVSSVAVNGRPARHASARSHELVVTPPATLPRGRPVTIVVRYAGTPSQVKVDGRTKWQRTVDGAVAAGEPEMAWWWFPSNDHPLDKATYDVSIEVPQGTTAISNGLLTGRTSRVGWTRYTWREARPQASYLATLAIGGFDLRTGASHGGVPVVTAYSTKLGSDGGAARASVERTGEIVDWAAGIFGPYPFESAGGYVPQTTARFALESQTRVFYSPAFFVRGSNVYVVVHENAHQWFGDSVSVASWRNIWLNEGFATYAEWLWSEKQGEGTARELAAYTYSRHPVEDPFWQVKPGDPGKGREFHVAVYDRGALTLQALRESVGDSVFFRVLREWATAKRYGNATIEEFVAFAGRIAGRRLDPLFQAWLFTAGRPPAPAGWVTRPAGRRALVPPGSWETIHRGHGSVR